MKVHTTNYYNTLVAIADDCPAATGEVPPTKGDAKSVATMQFEMVSQNPYQYTSDEVFFQVYAERNDLAPSELAAAQAQFFSKGQPCFRASPLTKRYGWGVHSNESGKIALFGCETPEYQALVDNEAIKVVKGMKSSK
jgi:Family of unknown function (DUF6157)